MRQTLLVGLLLAAGLAGCLGDDAPTDDADPDALPTTDDAAHPLASVLYEGCYELLTITPAPMGEVAYALPDGFTAVPFDPAGTQATIVAISLQCTVNGTAVNEMLAMVQVEVPAAVASPNYTMHTVVLGGFSDSPAIVAAFASWGFNGTYALADSISQTRVGSAAAHPAFSTTGGMASVAIGDFSATMMTRVTSPDQNQPAGGARAFAPGDADHAIDVAWSPSAQFQGAGEMHFSNGPLPDSVSAGIGIHNFGADYWIRMSPADLGHDDMDAHLHGNETA